MCVFSAVKKIGRNSILSGFQRLGDSLRLLCEGEAGQTGRPFSLGNRETEGWWSEAWGWAGVESQGVVAGEGRNWHRPGHSPCRAPVGTKEMASSRDHSQGAWEGKAGTHRLGI